MPPLPVIANVYRCTWNYTAFGGVTAHNVLHFESTSSDEAGLAATIEDNLTTNMISPVYDIVTVESVDVIKLDGSSATQNFPISSGASGTTTGDIIPAAAAVLSLHTAQRGPEGRGRLYIGPIGETLNSDGLISTVATAAVVTAWEAFATAIAADDWLHVVASYVHAVARPVISYSMRPQLGTVRRRQEQLLH